MRREEAKKITERKREDRERSRRSQKENLKERGKIEKDVGEAKKRT